MKKKNFILVVVLSVGFKLFSKDFIIDPYNRRYEIEMITPKVFNSSDIKKITEFFKENGYVVVDNVSECSHRCNLVNLVHSLLEKNIPFLRQKGFLDLYHDDSLAQLRQNPLLYNVFASIFDTEKLWVVFDRIIYQSSNEGEDPLAPHVDQNPRKQPDFCNVQAMLALRDMNEFTGTLALVPKSYKFFHEYKQWSDDRVGYVEYKDQKELLFIGLRLNEGQLVIWDSRMTHSRYRSKDKKLDRYAALLTFVPAKNDPELTDLRMRYFNEGVGCSNHEAGMRATANVRCKQSLRQKSEELSPLGRKLYGFDSWFN